MAVVDPEYDYAFRENEDRIAGAPKSALANSLMDQAQLGYRLTAWKSDAVIIDIRRNESAFCRAEIELYREGQLQLSMTAETESLATAIRAVEKRLEA